MDLQEEFKLTYLFISHDLKVVKHVSNRVAVMYLGKVVEQASADEIYSNPQHPYTRALLSAIPLPDPLMKKDRIILQGDVPSPINPPTGCYFHPRCPIGKDRPSCKSDYPALKEPDALIGKKVPHLASCHYAGESLK